MKFLLPLVILIILGWFYVGQKNPQSEAAAITNSGPPNPPEIRLIPQSPMNTDYGAEGGSTKEDLHILQTIVQDCQLLIKDFDRYHLPDNPAIIRFLQGANPEKLAWISQSNPFIDEEGQLLDRQGKPVIFHRLSGLKYEFRAAGPDGKPWTKDDIIVGDPPAAKEQ